MACPDCDLNRYLLEKSEKALSMVAKPVYAADHQEKDVPFWTQACLHKMNVARKALIELYRMKGNR